MGPTAFRDGIFSSSDPMAKYGTLLTSYSDGSVGAMPPFVDKLRRRAGFGAMMSAASSCQRLCIDVNTMYGTPQRIKACNTMCNRFPARWSKRLARRYKAGIAQGLPPTRQVQSKAQAAAARSTSGLGELDSTTMTAVGMGVVVVGGLLWLGTRK